MKIDRDMHLESLRERMGTEATPEDARAMRDVLLTMRCADTDDMTEAEWLHAMTVALRHGRLIHDVQAAAAQHGFVARVNTQRIVSVDVELADAALPSNPACQLRFGMSVSRARIAACIERVCETLAS